MEFGEWIRFVFEAEHPRNICQVVRNSMTPETMITYLTRLFNDSGSLLATYSDDQIACGLEFLQNRYLWRIGDSSVSLDVRMTCLSAMYALYTDIFVPRCEEKLGHCSEEMGEINGVCYMMFELGCWINVADVTLTKTVVTLLRRILELPHAGCQESALHGLGHWGLYFRKEIQAPINAFLKSGAARRPELIDYAKKARESCIQ